ncbi:hypothetical protein ADU37_CDS06640 [Thermococcus sp. 2319x1]|uniref:hypothetical protein n=1 Tax=Thermococcus sp. 2319x1 TaxID=1674923 RepID=UPI00073A6FB1|nr:hypothetical protein [Thermococcus sp. 2319x1]ALV62363.1 hypothetical protein ADU37_CDS06640 [Thermococcus sp. 2319x1]
MFTRLPGEGQKPKPKTKPQKSIKSEKVKLPLGGDTKEVPEIPGPKTRKNFVTKTSKYHNSLSDNNLQLLKTSRATLEAKNQNMDKKRKKTRKRKS